jgi:mannose-6-phosphate isomerase-like protein (cupin superfamily)
MNPTGLSCGNRRATSCAGGLSLGRWAATRDRSSDKEDVMQPFSSAARLVATLALSAAIGLLTLESANAEPAFVRSAAGSELAWGPCPDFFPAGCNIAVLHGDPAKPNADVFFRVPGEYDLPKHWHTSAERMVLVSGELSVTYEGQDAVVLKPGMYAYGPAKAPHHGRCVSKKPCTLFIAFETPVDATAVASPATQ